MKSLYKSEEGKQAILNLYDEKLEELQIDCTYKTVNTSFGQTNLLITGKATNPPLIIVHGSNACAPIGLETYPDLSEKYQLFAVDVLAQPNKSAETRLSMKDNSYGKWMNEIIDALGFEQVTMAGFSFGGLVILKTLEYNETKVKEVFLSAPAYIVNGNPIKALIKIFIPMRLFMSTQKQKYVEKFLSQLFSDKDTFAIKFLSKVFLNFEMDFSPVPVINKKAAEKITIPINIFAAENDILFPGEKMINRAKKIFPSLKKVLLLENSKHVQSKKDNKRIVEMIKNEL